PEHHQNFKQEPFQTSNKELDALLGGGIDRGTSTMFLGPPGAGKSTMALKYACVAAAHGERVDFYLFDEGEHSLVKRGKLLGMDIQPFLKSGVLKVQKI